MKLSPLRRSAFVCVLVTALTASACSVPTDAERAKAAEEKAKKSMLAIDHRALDQKIDPERVKKIQQQLATLNEYLGAVNGKLDQVTINAYEAFQRSNDLFPDGMFDDEGLRLLEAAAAKRDTAAKG